MSAYACVSSPTMRAVQYAMPGHANQIDVYLELQVARRGLQGMSTLNRVQRELMACCALMWLCVNVKCESGTYSSNIYKNTYRLVDDRSFVRDNWKKSMGSQLTSNSSHNHHYNKPLVAIWDGDMAIRQWKMKKKNCSGQIIRNDVSVFTVNVHPTTFHRYICALSNIHDPAR